MELSEALLTFIVGGIVLLAAAWVLGELPSRSEDKFGTEELGFVVAAFALGFVAENLTGAAFRSFVPKCAPSTAVAAMPRQFNLAWKHVRWRFPEHHDLTSKAAHERFSSCGGPAMELYYEAVNWGRTETNQHAEVGWLHRRALFARTCGISLLLLALSVLLLAWLKPVRTRTCILRARATARFSARSAVRRCLVLRGRSI